MSLGVLRISTEPLAASTEDFLASTEDLQKCRMVLPTSTDVSPGRRVDLQKALFHFLQCHLLS